MTCRYIISIAIPSFWCGVVNIRYVISIDVYAFITRCCNVIRLAIVETRLADLKWCQKVLISAMKECGSTTLQRVRVW